MKNIKGQESVLHTQEVNLEKIRRRFFAVATFLGGLITFILIADDQISASLFFNIACSTTWLVLSFLFQFGRTEMRRLELIAFANLVCQFVLTQLVDLVLLEPNAATYFSDAVNTIFILSILVIVAFSLFSIKQATMLSGTFSILTALIFIAAAVNLPDNTGMQQLSLLIEPSFYFIISFYLVRALSSFRLEANSAKSAAKVYEHLAYFDELTGIANRRKLVNILEKEISRSQRYETPLSIIIFDIDHFKTVNDSYGHNVGDKVLKAIANSVANTIRTNDCLGRWGGEEFMCVLPNTTANVAFEMAERLRLGISDSLLDGGPDITASFGIAQLINLDNFDSFVLRADQALYNAKDQGRNRCKPNPLLETAGDFSFAELPKSRPVN